MYQAEGQSTRAEPLLIKLLEIRRRVLGPQHPDTTNVLALRGEVRLQQQRYSQAEPLLREARNGQEHQSPDTWQRYDTQSRLGASLAAQAKFAEAEPLLLAGYDLQHQARIPWES